jgi:hypothetical protein
LKADEKKAQKKIAEEAQPPTLIKASSQMYRPQRKDMGKGKLPDLAQQKVRQQKRLAGACGKKIMTLWRALNCDEMTPGARPRKRMNSTGPAARISTSRNRTEMVKIGRRL